MKDAPRRVKKTAPYQFNLDSTFFNLFIIDNLARNSRRLSDCRIQYQIEEVLSNEDPLYRNLLVGK